MIRSFTDDNLSTQLLALKILVQESQIKFSCGQKIYGKCNAVIHKQNCILVAYSDHFDSAGRVMVEPTHLLVANIFNYQKAH